MGSSFCKTDTLTLTNRQCFLRYPYHQKQFLHEIMYVTFSIITKDQITKPDLGLSWKSIEHHEITIYLLYLRKQSTTFTKQNAKTNYCCAYHHMSVLQNLFLLSSTDKTIIINYFIINFESDRLSQIESFLLECESRPYVLSFRLLHKKVLGPGKNSPQVSLPYRRSELQGQWFNAHWGQKYLYFFLSFLFSRTYCNNSVMHAKYFSYLETSTTDCIIKQQKAQVVSGACFAMLFTFPPRSALEGLYF